MLQKVALVNFNKCRPEACDSGVCAAARACSRKLLKQEAPLEIAMSDPFLCRGCGDCVRACPSKAIVVLLCNRGPRRDCTESPSPLVNSAMLTLTTLTGDKKDIYKHPTTFRPCLQFEVDIL
jgi:ferredoxin